MPLFGKGAGGAAAGSSEKGAGRATPFIEWDEKKKKFSVNDEGARYLSSFDGKIAVTIVAGRYRSGKSFLMNQLLGGNGGFSVGHTVESHTKGIWIASGAGGGVEAKTVTGETVPMIFMDSEGLGATDKVRQDARMGCAMLIQVTFVTSLFSSSLLTSSLFVCRTSNMTRPSFRWRLCSAPH